MNDQDSDDDFAEEWPPPPALLRDGPHTVEDGDSISSIADRAGHFWQTLWDDPRNQSLRELRKNPNVLLPGDVVHIPAKQLRTKTATTGETYTFKRKGVPAVFRLQLFQGGEPRARQTFTMVIDGRERNGTTDGDGVLELRVAPTAQLARLVIGPDEAEYRVRIGRLDPADDLRGIQQRLNNLGFGCGIPDGTLNDATRCALENFQALENLEVSGRPDDGVRARLIERHDSLGAPAPGNS
jgi:N-acetylmuramoyl-L-alanine amidase